VQWDHPALKGQYRGWNSTTAAVDHNYSWWDAIHTSIGGSSCGINLAAPCDDYGHGTHTTGTGVGEDAGQVNQIGMAPGAKWIACRNMDAGVGRPSAYIECLDFFIQPWDLNHQNPDPSKHADVISNSYTCPVSELCDSTSLHTAVENVRAAGIFMSVSAGNSGSSCYTIYDPPSTEAGVFTVGATNSADGIAAFSSRGPVGSLLKPQISAPGVSVRSAYPGDSYTAMSGTSMAAPHVAGAVALLWSAFPLLRGSVAATEALLEQSAVKRYSTTLLCGTDTATSWPNNVYGYGRLDVKAAYDLFASGWPLAPAITAVAGTLPVSNTIQISWTDPNVGATAYTVERSDDRVGWTEVANLPGTQTTYTDTVPAARTYFYRVYAAQGSFLSSGSGLGVWQLFWLPLTIFQW
jgi:subtilisin family serine protease